MPFLTLPAELRADAPAVPSRDAVVTRYLLERHAEHIPDSVFAVFADGPTWTWAQAAEAARQAATGLARAGVRQGDRVLSWLPNGPDAIRTWFGANWLGAAYVPMNIAYRGGLLEHVVENAGAEVLVCHAALVPRLNEVKRERLRTVLVPGPRACDPPEGLTIVFGDVLSGEVSDELLRLDRPIEPWDEQSIIYTSGTTGPSKGVLSSYCHSAATAACCYFDGKDFTRDFRYLVSLPLFHAGGTLPVTGALLTGTSVAVVDRFETGRFLEVARDTGATCCTLLGAMATFLLKQPPSPGDRDHSLSMVFLLPLGDQGPRIRERFGVDVHTVFNMTEVSAPILSEANPRLAGTCGRRRKGVEARLVDAHDVEVPDGAVGEMIIRADRPWSMSHGYNNMPEATAKAWRNGWFHTGDAFRRDQDGNYFFVDRVKDAIRRRGENVSSFEVERECLAHDDVCEAAAVAVPSEFGEDEILVVVAPVPGRRIEPALLLEFLRPRMAHFMVPRFIRVLEALPKTPTEKVLKSRLREEGVTPDTWDRERFGIQVKAERIS